MRTLISNNHNTFSKQKYIIVFFAEKPEGEVEEVETTTMLVSIVPTEEEMTTLPPDSGKSVSF